MVRTLVGVAAAVVAVVFPAGAGQADPTTFDAFTTVDVANYKTFKTYGWSGVQFVTSSGVRCRMYDGPESFQYSAGVDCWGALPGVAPEMNFVKVSLQPYVASTSTPVPSGGVPVGTPVVYSLFRHVDDFSGVESYLDGPTDRRTVDPASYHLLADGQKIVVPGTRDGGDRNRAVCAAGAGGVLECQVQNMSTAKGGTHGFRLSPQGSSTY